jgi:outer membrane protein OmpA-like peptidoglycan-associated protein
VGSVTARLSNSDPTAVYDGSDTQFAYQGIVGTAYSLTNSLSLTADYRYMATTAATIQSDTRPVSVDTGNHTLMAGVRWNFGGLPERTPEAPVVQSSYVPPPPRPAPSVATDYLVFFDWNQTTVTREGRQIINDAAIASGRSKPVTIQVTGHTDTSGTLQYNQVLSERRAEAVKNELVLRGVDPRRIRTIGKADSDLMVPTAKGVREPSNRRAQIVLHVG